MLHRIAHVAKQQRQFSSSPVTGTVRVLGVTTVHGRPAMVMERALSDATRGKIFTSNQMLSPSPGWRGWPEASDWWECCPRNGSILVSDTQPAACPSGLPIWALHIIAHDVLQALVIVHAAQVCFNQAPVPAPAACG